VASSSGATSGAHARWPSTKATPNRPRGHLVAWEVRRRIGRLLRSDIRRARRRNSTTWDASRCPPQPAKRRCLDAKPSADLVVSGGCAMPTWVVSI
jgi:hypothetical protein